MLGLKKNMKDKEFIVTDQSWFEEHKIKDYNPYDKTRKPHAVTLVDPDTGTIVLLYSGSRIKIVNAREVDK